MRLLFIADVMGRPGRKALAALLPGLRRELNPDLIIANGENAAGGAGLTPKIAGELFERGIDLLTGGNHSFDNKEGLDFLRADERVLRPQNYPELNPGRGRAVLPLPDGGELLVLNLQGRVFMPAIDCPFRCADEELAAWSERGPVLVDFHAEATSEKIALARHLEGRVTALIGTHTHVQTADARILPEGTAILTDAGLTGSHGGVIGIESELVIERFLTQTLRRFQLSKNDIHLQGATLDFDPGTGKALSIEAFDLHLEE